MRLHSDTLRIYSATGPDSYSTMFRTAADDETTPRTNPLIGKVERRRNVALSPYVTGGVTAFMPPWLDPLSHTTSHSHYFGVSHTMQPITKELMIHEVRIDGGTQPRVEINEDAVMDYADALEAGQKLPPVTVFYDGKRYWLADGFHRYHAHMRLDIVDIDCTIHEGSRRDAILYSVGANAEHGLRRSNEDKREAVETLLRDEEWSTWSNREIARRCKVSDPFVAKIRDSLTANVSSEKRTYTTKHGTTATMNTSNIGKQASHESAPDDEELQEIEPWGDPLATVPAAPARTTTSVSHHQHQQAAPCEQREVPTDAMGTPLPSDDIIEDFNNIRRIKAVQASLKDLRKQIHELVEMPFGAFLTQTQLDAHIKNLHAALKFSIPYAVCPMCKGKKCDSCRTVGWMPKEVYERVPRDLR